MASKKALQACKKRSEEYYPTEKLKKELNEHKLITGEAKSELAVKLLRSFFDAKRKEGKYPTTITILP